VLTHAVRLIVSVAVHNSRWSSSVS